MQQYKKILGKVMMTAEGTYDSNKGYDPISLITDEETGKSYISRKEVPAGTQINNREYWQPVASSGIIDNGVIILNRKNSDGQVPIHDLKSAAEAVAVGDRKGGVILGFLGFNPETDTVPTWKLYQYNDVSPSNWTNIDYWLPMDYTNKYAGWFDNEEALYNSVPFPKIGMYAYVGNSVSSAIIYRCYNDRVWHPTEDKAFSGVVNLADEEDITNKQNKLKFKDKEYNPAQFSGLGKLYLRKNVIDGKNILTQTMMQATNTIYIIQYNYDLQDETITIPEGCTLDFQGGSFSNGTIVFNDTNILGTKCIDKTIILKGTLKNDFLNLNIYKIEVSDDISNILSNVFLLGINVEIPLGKYKVSNVHIPVQMAGKCIKGCGYNYYSEEKVTLLYNNVGSSFILEDGANNILFRDFSLKGENSASIGIDASFGSYCSLINLGIFGFNEIGVKIRQGLWRIDNIFVGANANIGLELYSDSTITNSEFSGGNKPLRILAGGNRISNVWANTANICCVELTPLDDNTTHINTSISGLYVGDVRGNNEYCIRITGTDVQKVQHVQIVNLSIQTAIAFGNTHSHILIDKVKHSMISNSQGIGLGLYSNENSYTKSFADIKNSDGISICNSVIQYINGNAINLDTTDANTIINGNNFVSCGTDEEHGANIKGTGYGLIVANNIFYSDNNYTFAGDAQGRYMEFRNNIIRYPNTIIVKNNKSTYDYTRQDKQAIINKLTLYGSTIDVNCINKGRNLYKSSEFYCGGGVTTNIYDFTNDKTENKVFLISVTQNGTSVNGCFGLLFMSSSNASVVTLANTNTDSALINSFGISGNNLTFKTGSGYGETTWVLNITSL